MDSQKKTSPPKTTQGAQQTLPVDKLKHTPKAKTSDFLEYVLKYFSTNNIVVHDQEVIKKNEIDFVIGLPSQLGNLKYYCKAKSKKRSNDADLSTAFTQGQLRKLPVLYLSDGDLTKRAKKMLETQLTGIAVKRM